jgi:hypothetical protein
MGLSAATVALALLSGATQAQQAVAVAPVTKAAVTPAAAQTEPKKLARRVASKCKGLDETTCSGTPGCTWVAATKTKTGREVKAYCRTKSRTAGKSAAPAGAKPGEPAKKY